MKHKHFDLIQKWANDPKNTQIEYFHNRAWHPSFNPVWDEDTEYRIKPKPVELWVKVCRCKDTGSIFTITKDTKNGFDNMPLSAEFEWVSHPVCVYRG